MTQFAEYAMKRELQQFTEEVERHARDYARVEVLAEVGGFPIQHVVVNPRGGRTVCFIAGLHGDEPGGPYGVLQFIKQRIRIPESVRVEIIPMANPTGFVKRTRENADGFDLNGKFHDEELVAECEAVWRVLNRPGIECLHTLHEDTDVNKFYVYYTHQKTLASGLRDDVARRFFGIEEQDAMCEGLIALPHSKSNTVEERALVEQSIPYIITETPGKATLRSRSRCNRDMIKYVIHNF